MKRHSLRFRLAGILMGYGLLIAVLFVGATALWLSQNLERRFEQEYRSLTELFAEQAFLSVYVGNPLSAEGVLESMVSGDIVYAQIVKDGEIVAQEVRGGADFPATEVPVDLTMQQRPGPEGQTVLDFTRGLVGRAGTTVTSYVRLGVSLAPLQAAFRTQMWTLALIGLGVTTVGAVLGLLLFRELWLPLQRLIQAVQRLGQGDLTAQAPVDRNDELGLLAQEFNRMAARIAEKNRELEALNLELQKANHTKTEFLTIMSHELRTPLNAVLGYAELLEQGKYGPLDPPQRRPLRRVLRAGEHLLSLIEKTLNFAKLELGVERLHLTQVDGPALVVDCLEQLQPLAEERSVSLHADAQPVVFEADAVKLKQILLNLIQNAIQHTQDGDVTTRLSEEGDRVILTVTDTGTGFDPAQAPALFKPFARGDDAGRASQSGVGLGLAVVDRYTRMHGGRVDVDSTIGRGTRFTVTLPKRAPAPATGGDSDETERH